MSIEVALCTINHHAKTPRGHKRPQKAQKATTDTNATTGWLAFPQNISLKTQKSPKTKMINRIPKTEAKHRSPQCHWLPPTGFRGFKIQILIKFTVRPSHVQSQNHLQKEWSNSPKAHMINGVLLFGFQCPNAQTLATWLTACLKHGWIIVSKKTQAKK